jgi:hypothetical protein
MMGANEIETFPLENLWLTQVISRNAKKFFQVLKILPHIYGEMDVSDSNKWDFLNQMW